MIKKIKKNRGATIIETLFYIVLFTMLSIAITNALITMMKSFKETAIEREIAQSGTIMETMAREIKKANSINSISATDWTLNTKDDAGNNKTIQFVLSGTDIQFKENNVLTGNLNIPNISITSLSFTEITTAKGKAVKIVLTLNQNKDTGGNNENFYDTVVLRGAYD